MNLCAWVTTAAVGLRPAHTARNLNDVGPDWMSRRLALLATISLPVDVVPSSGLKTLLATLMHAFVTQNDLPYQDRNIVMSPVPCQKSHHRDNYFRGMHIYAKYANT